jgi:hypothetical protein
MLIKSGNIKELPSFGGYQVRNLQTVGHYMMWLCLVKVCVDKNTCLEANIYLVQPRLRLANFACAPHFSEILDLRVNLISNSEVKSYCELNVAFETGESISYRCDDGLYLVSENAMHV